MQIWAHTLVKNEGRYLWFAVESVINYVERLLLWDTGSTDSTRDIIKILKKKHAGKIETASFGDVTPEQYTMLRQEMLHKTKSDWFIIVDGDEVWWDEGIENTSNLIRNEGNEYETIVSNYYNVVGDIFHFQEDAAGMYKIDESRGHINIRAINKSIPGLYTAKPHGQHGYFDDKNNLIQNRTSSRRYHLNQKAYLHFTHVARSTSSDKDLLVPKRKMKLKYDLGISFPRDFFYPQVFFRGYPEIVPSPWNNRDKVFFTKSIIQTPLRKIKRRIIRNKVGY